ncbi:MAG: ISAs1 family transposase [bacterium]|nr:ISAs1 family transposase [bacterium]
MKRQAATPKGLGRRIRDLGFQKVGDPRMAGKVTYPLPTVLTALVVGMTTRARSLRTVEQRSEQVAKKHEGWMGLKQRIADNTLGDILPGLVVGDLVACMHRGVKAEARRGNLKPTVLPVGTIAIDGKNVATLHWHDVCRVLGLEKTEVQPNQVKALLAERFPDVQFCVPAQGQPYALARVHTVTMISSDAAVCIHQRQTLGHTNEIGSMPDLLEEVHTGYGRTGLIKMVTTDAGNTSLKVAGLILRYRWDYFLQIKSGQGDLYTEAVRALGSQTEAAADITQADQQNGKIISYHLWQHDLSEQGWLSWTHARQLVRIQRTEEDPDTGEKKIGNRFYVCNRTSTELRPKGCLKISRAHWRCENETHWTADAESHEDRRRLAWSRHPQGVFTVSILRRIAVNILAVARRLSHMGHCLETPTWQHVADHFLLVLCDSILQTEAFDAAQ